MVLHGCVISGRDTASKVKTSTTEGINFSGESPVRRSLNLVLDKPAQFDPEQIEFVGGKRAFF